MTRQTRTLHALAALMISGAVHTAAEGAATVNFSCRANGINLQSDLAPLTADFAFQIGTFAGNFEPTAANTAQWLAHWVALGDAAADPIPGATAPYEEKQLPPPFPAGTVTAGFSGSAQFDHNEPPFQAMGAVYVWGYDNRTAAGPAEWILVTSSTWGWPSGTTNPPAETFSVTDADTVILGAVNGPGFHLQTAAVVVEPNSAPAGYESWLAAQFPAGILADPDLAEGTWGVLADPDRDGIANVIEYFTASDPNDTGSQRATSAAVQGGDLVFTFYQAKDVTGVEATVEWSAELTHWHSDSVTLGVVEDLGEVYKVEARIPLGGHPEKFARLNVRRAFE